MFVSSVSKRECLPLAEGVGHAMRWLRPRQWGGGAMLVCRICSLGPSRATSFRAGGRWGEGRCSEQLSVVSSRGCDGMGKGNCSRGAWSQIRRKRRFSVGGGSGRRQRHATPEVVRFLSSRRVRQAQKSTRTTTGFGEGDRKRRTSCLWWCTGPLRTNYQLLTPSKPQLPIADSAKTPIANCPIVAE